MSVQPSRPTRPLRTSICPSCKDMPTYSPRGRVLITFCVVLLFCSGSSAGEGGTQSEPVLAQNLSGNVLWTRRPDRYTLQVLTNFRPSPSAKGTVPKPAAMTGRQVPAIEVWLLKKEGSTIPAVQRWQTPTSNTKPGLSREFRAEVLYAYPLSEGAEAVAAVICIDGDCVVRRIAPFPQ
jgi:hypothetical protein